MAAHPGMAQTNLGSEYALTNWIMRLSAPFGQGSAAARALPLLRAATDPAVLGGQFYGPKWGVFGPPVLETPSQQARDSATARALWDVSAALTDQALRPA